MPQLPRAAVRTFALIAVPSLLLAVGCRKQAPPAKTPLSQMTAAPDSTANPHSTMSPEARAALDSGNAQYRAGRYPAALASYRKSSALAPLNAAPYFGIYMAAEKVGDKKLADSATAEIQRLQGSGSGTLTDSALQAMHATAGKSKN